MTELISKIKNTFRNIAIKKKPEKEKQVASIIASREGFLDEALKSEANGSKAVIYLRNRFCDHIEYYQESAEIGGNEKSEASEAFSENELEKLKKFLNENCKVDGQLPSEKSIMKSFEGINRIKVFRMKTKLCESGFLCLVNGRYKMAVTKTSEK